MTVTDPTTDTAAGDDPAATAEHRYCPFCNIAATGTWCERCSEALVATTNAPATVPPRWLSSAAAADACGSCGAAAVGTDGYCGRCGHRRGAGRDRAELDLGVVAGVTDRGRRKPRNEDAMAVGRYGSATVAVVCDGVSSSTRPEEAAVAAVERGVETLLDSLASGADPRSATETAALAAGDAAAAAVARAGILGPDGPPCCTYVSAVVTDTTVTIGWVGDSRAYWVGPDGARCLTVDDSLAGQLHAAGVSAEDSRFADPRAHALMAWLGADAEDVKPHVVSFPPAVAGTVVVCSDGLSRYLRTPAELTAMLAASDGDDSPAVLARHLTQRALDHGGHDNIGIAVIHVTPDSATTVPITPDLGSGEPSDPSAASEGQKA